MQYKVIQLLQPNGKFSFSQTYIKDIFQVTRLRNKFRILRKNTECSFIASSSIFKKIQINKKKERKKINNQIQKIKEIKINQQEEKKLIKKEKIRRQREKINKNKIRQKNKIKQNKIKINTQKP
ncbi:hypothetical protein TTHERM_000449039 (macronuclear) [Tetrahymena thermophila SB210]|uniref:Uncharacterized protein n=1 Tax=Tetrahymena thermophila (strain SB210) TaxID=312017 RepID=W7XJ02_TETTS|nr:hypothetical protein TTHERM_000449039 [Tetrahymena thermophila SB210]EWS75071.1 hypothetical protein TTHERM_000449039 [Tetrahymena thermophila SB210]|eukprot:XP_012652384.1 hypothetical protein TTHERM_000449039 [Tetrahymena thermophila SB210]